MQKRITRIAIAIGLILLIPVFGNFYIEGWNWSFGDFVVMGMLLFVTSLAIDFAVRKFTITTHRVFAIFSIVAMFLLIWAGMVHNVGERLLEKIFCSGVC